MAILSGLTRRVQKAQNVALTVLADYGNDVDAYGDRLPAICDDVFPNDNAFVGEVEEAIDVFSGNAAKRQADYEKAKQKKRDAYSRAA